ncbi:MAG: hypothetical protein WDO16_03155 [Bacteroidota bacterium]
MAGFGSKRKLVERTKLYNPDAQAITANKHELRPIPQSQLNNITDPDKAKYQNPDGNRWQLSFLEI